MLGIIPLSLLHSLPATPPPFLPLPLSFPLSVAVAVFLMDQNAAVCVFSTLPATMTPAVMVMVMDSGGIGKPLIKCFFFFFAYELPWLWHLFTVIEW